jgi:ATPase subunit of ABC transporter with duplicated ATPase domains
VVSHDRYFLDRVAQRAQAFVLGPLGSFAGLALSAGRKLVLGD